MPQISQCTAQITATSHKCKKTHISSPCASSQFSYAVSWEFIIIMRLQYHKCVWNTMQHMANLNSVEKDHGNCSVLWVALWVLPLHQPQKKSKKFKGNGWKSLWLYRAMPCMQKRYNLPKGEDHLNGKWKLGPSFP